ncbi:hypothetical protein ACQUWN_13795 [Rossellomorea aquimaris]|uniref:hypothetical protein n=1 Tax=Rossellomorea TaxID=2837508 RepID=UPI001653C150|nr:hypothetical protein [Rossellomorea vietnamensis]
MRNPLKTSEAIINVYRSILSAVISDTGPNKAIGKARHSILRDMSMVVVSILTQQV